MNLSRRQIVKAGVATAACLPAILGSGAAAALGRDASSEPGERNNSMRTRYLTSLNNFEISDYLKRNDVIFIPVGTVEMHGVMPVECEYMLPLGFALKLAEEVDGLVLPHLPYFYPGGTAIGEGTVYVSPSAGMAYLKEVCRSLLRQGFRRQLLLTAHGPALVTLLPVVREFFDETKCPIVYLDLNTYFGQAESQGVETDFNKMIWGAYAIAGRLDDIHIEPAGVKRAQYPEALATLQRGKAGVGFFFGEVTNHGWFPAKALSAEERAARAAEGVAQIEAVAKSMNIKSIVDAMREHDRFTQEQVLSRHRDRLP